MTIEEKKQNAADTFARLADDYLATYLVLAFTTQELGIYTRSFIAYHALELWTKASSLNLGLEIETNHKIRPLLNKLSLEIAEIKEFLPKEKIQDVHKNVYNANQQNVDLGILLGPDRQQIELEHLIDFNADLKYDITNKFELKSSVNLQMMPCNLDLINIIKLLRKSYNNYLDLLNMWLLGRLTHNLPMQSSTYFIELLELKK